MDNDNETLLASDTTAEETTVSAGYLSRTLAIITSVSLFILGLWIKFLGFITTVSAYLRRNWLKVLSVTVFTGYLALVIHLFYFQREQYSGRVTHPIVDAVYFWIVTMTSVGYGDIVPLTQTSKLMTIAFVIINILFFDIIICFSVDHVQSLQERLVLLIARRNRANNVEVDGAMRRRMRKMKAMWRLGLAVGVVFVCIGIGTCVLGLAEELNFLESMYLSFISISTVGYGDEAFETIYGRIFAVFWLVFCSIAMACFNDSFAEMRAFSQVAWRKSELELIVLKLIESGRITQEEMENLVDDK